MFAVRQIFFKTFVQFFGGIEEVAKKGFVDCFLLNYEILNKAGNGHHS